MHIRDPLPGGAGVKCPKCEHVNADGVLECAQCGIVFSKWKDAWDRQAPAWPPPAPPPPAPAPTSGRTILKVAGLLVLAVGWYWFMLWSPGGLAVPEQAYRDQERGFALVVPEGWQAARMNECRTIAAGLTPATACVAPPIHLGALDCGESNLAELNRIMRFAAVSNLTGLPAITFPVGYTTEGLPIGYQLIGRPWSEGLLLRAANAIDKLVERRQPRWHRTLLGTP